MPWTSRPVNLTPQQRTALKNVRHSKSATKEVKCRALIVLLLGEGLKNREIAKRLNIHMNTVVKWRGRWTGDNRYSTVEDHGNITGRPVTILTPGMLGKIQTLIRKPPSRKSRWTVRSLAEALKLPSATTQRALKELEIDLKEVAIGYPRFA